MSNKNIECPFCSRVGKFAFLKAGDSGLVHCFFCNEKTSLYNFLKEVDRLDLVEREKSISINNKLVSLKDREEIKEKELIEVKLPHKLTLIENDDYLDSRGFLVQHYKEFEPSYTSSIIEKKLHNYLIFKIKQNGLVVSWLARSKYSYGWHKENLEKSKLNEEKLVLRYRNSDGTEFEKILGGYDEITEKTHTVILVEGLFDKVGVDGKLNLYSDESIGCCFTFGNKISDYQIKLLKKKKNVKNVILLYDYGTVKQSKGSSLRLSKSFNTLVGVPKTEEDPGDMTPEQLFEILDNLQSPIEFYINNL
jgi:hypothetical protein